MTSISQATILAQTPKPKLSPESIFGPVALAGWWSSLRSLITTNVTQKAGGGTISQAANTVTGVGTSFVHDVFVGDRIRATGIDGIVTAITSGVSLTLSSSATAGPGLAYTIDPMAGVSDRITQLNDKAVNANHLTPQGVDRQVALMPNRINGRPAMVGNGVSSVLEKISPVGLSAGLKHLIIGSVFKQTGTDRQMMMELESGSAGDGFLGTYFSQADAAANNYMSLIDEGFATGPTLLSLTTIAGLVTCSIAHFVYNGTSALYLNGVQEITNPDYNADVTATVATLALFGRRGGTISLEGALGEMVIALSSTPFAQSQITNLDRWFRQEWGS